MKPFDTMVGVHRISLSLRRTVMLPSFAAANPLAYSRRPISQICSLSLNSGTCMFIISKPQDERSDSWGSLHIQRIEDTRAIRIQWFLVRMERHRCFDAFTHTDLASVTGAQFIQNNDVFAVGRRFILQRLQTVRH